MAEIKSNGLNTSGGVPDNFPKIRGAEIIGLPPSYYYESDDLYYQTHVVASMPVMAIYPAYPSYGDVNQEKMGLQLHYPNREKGLGKYNNILKQANIPPLSGSCLYVAFINDASISESFSVDYGESKFEEIGNMASSTLAEVQGITGQKDMAKGFADMAKSMGGGPIGSLMGGATKLTGKALGAAQTVLNKMMPGMGNILTGNKIDFPMIWKGSSYAPSYSMTIRLYNPLPQNIDAHKKYIIYPLAKLLAFVMPILGESGVTAGFPITCQVSCPGLFKIKHGFISSIEIIKGGDAQDISYIQRPGMIDIRLTLNDMYNTMVAHADDTTTLKDEFRPSFKDYIKQLESKTKISSSLTEKSKPGELLGEYFEMEEGEVAYATSASTTKIGPVRDDYQEIIEEPTDRVSQTKIDIANDLTNETT